MSDFVVDPDQDVNLVMSNFILVGVYLLQFFGSVIYFGRMDDKFANCLKLAFKLNGPETSIKNSNVRDEVNLLIQDLSNRQNCEWTVLIGLALRFELLLSFTNTLICFCVMVITTRIQMRDYLIKSLNGTNHNVK